MCRYLGTGLGWVGGRKRRIATKNSSRARKRMYMSERKAKLYAMRLRCSNENKIKNG